MFNKQELSEEDIKNLYITPAIDKKWSKQQQRMEYSITDGKINLIENTFQRSSPLAADYVLFLDAANPIAVVEAKKNTKTPSFGLMQAITYAKMLDVPFAYSSNGDCFIEHDFLTGVEKEISLEEFPSPEQLKARYDNNINDGEGISEEEKNVQEQPYYASATTYEPRYYQRNAINKTVRAVAKGKSRILLAMATGTGKTYVAFQIIYRLLKAGTIKKVLYLADRNNLVDQSIAQDFAPLEKSIHKVNFNKDDPTTITSYEVYFSLYQQLADREDDDIDEEGEGEAAKRLSKLFKKDFFDLIIVDECHRGSAKKDSNWRKILEYFSSATQIGMTATPKETKYVSNIDYFGEPLYTYSLDQGIKDGFLAPFRVINYHTNVDEFFRPYKGQRDKNGNLIEDRIYLQGEYDQNIILEDYTRFVAESITDYLKNTDRMQKTIIFCNTEEHADRMRYEIAKLNDDKVKENSDYVVRITGSDKYGKSKLKQFISVGEKYPVIATTSKLLNTGADCKMVKLIVIDQKVSSMTEFKQMVGRGTRIREEEGKTHFDILDFREATRLFADPDWDGEPIQNTDYAVVSTGKGPDSPDITLDGLEPQIPKTIPATKPIIDENGCKVYMTQKHVKVYDADGKLLNQQNVIDYTKNNIKDEFASLEVFINEWSSQDKKSAIKDALLKHGLDLEETKKLQNMEDVDDFDFICHVAFDKKPLTRSERANNVKKQDFLNKYSGVAREVLDELIDTYKNTGIYDIENVAVLKVDRFKKYGTPVRIVNSFGGKTNYMKAVNQLVNYLYKAS